ncbi:MAG: glycosyltransferase [Acidimicrobiales bacterium]
MLLIRAGAGTVGGIQRYGQSLTEALHDVADLSVLDVGLDGTPAGRIRAFGKGLWAAARERPQLLLLGHVGLGPIGLASRLLGLRYAVLVYGIEVWGERSLLRRLVLERASGVWAISRFTRSQVEERYPGSRPVQVIGGAVDRRFLAAQAETSSDFRILSVARAEHIWYKGVDTCAAAAGKLAVDHPLEYRIAGAVTEADKRSDVVRELGVDGSGGVVRWLGELDDDELLDEYRKASVVVLVSRFRGGSAPAGEGLGLAVLEGGAVGVPGIGSTIGGTTDCIVDGTTGYLVPPDDVDALQDRLRSLLENPPLRRSMGEHARAWVAEHFSPEAFSVALAGALAHALERPVLDVVEPQA